ncbi:hypothetical protein P3G55_11465 [Leptospira sp. 96542]|nr:hypothetical protein [Leptospira sp. 96542]
MNFIKQCPNCSTMLRFPESQGTILVQCPVCSHRFTFQKDTEDVHGYEIEKETLPNFIFKPSFKSYSLLLLDLLYAPIDFIKSKQNSNLKKFRLIPILLVCIFLLYLWKWNRKPDLKPLDVQTPSTSPIEENPTEEPLNSNQTPTYEI